MSSLHTSLTCPLVDCPLYFDCTKIFLLVPSTQASTTVVESNTLSDTHVGAVSTEEERVCGALIKVTAREAAANLSVADATVDDPPNIPVTDLTPC